MNKMPPIEGVSDSERRINVWTRVPGNSPRSKFDDMEIDFGSCDCDLGRAIVGSAFHEEKRALDTYTYHNVIKKGYVPHTYTDEPYIIPYVVNKGAPSVIVIPGGAYCYVTSDGAEYEGKTIALDLNSRGVSAFVLHYRVNPYRFPLPLLDVQRAVRYIRAHADELGVSADLIGLVGFSAGGYEVGGFINLLRGRDMFPADYEPDEVDALGDGVFSAGLVYPVVNYRFNVPMLFNSFAAADVRDDVKRNAILDETDLILNFDSADVPQFVTYGTADTIVGTDGGRDYAGRAAEAGTNVAVLPVEGGGHGYGRENYIERYLDWLTERIGECEAATK